MLNILTGILGLYFLSYSIFSNVQKKFSLQLHFKKYKLVNFLPVNEKWSSNRLVRLFLSSILPAVAACP